MKFNSWLGAVATLSAAAMLLFTSGCDKPSESSGTKTSSEKTAATSTGPATDVAVDSMGTGDTAEHGHKDGQHGGIIVSLGSDSYHVEAVVAADGQIRLFMLGKDETRVIDVESQTLKGFVKGDGDTEAQEVSFEPAPQDGDAVNRTSLFVAKLPTSLVGRTLDVTIPNIRIEGERFRLGFRTVEPAHSDSAGMPGKVSGDTAEKELYLTPGGHYTAADIAANGNMTASQKFKGMKSNHNMNPKPGDRICPVSGTKANAQFTWVIGGKPYQFCCPPCVDEFLTNAKTSKEPLPDPESFKKEAAK